MAKKIAGIVKKAKRTKTTTPSKQPKNTGVPLEKIVTRIQQMMDPHSTVNWNEWLTDRVGNRRQYDVVIKGEFGGRPVLGIIECKDHNRKKGPADVEAFSKKLENLGARMGLMVSRKGFTPQALKLAKHEHIGCLSLLPDDPEQVGFSIGCMFYALINQWTNIQLKVIFADPQNRTTGFRANSVKWQGLPVMDWFYKQLFTTYQEKAKEGPFAFRVEFDQPKLLDFDGKEYPVIALECYAIGVHVTKRKWINWSGDAFYDWHTGRFTIPAQGAIYSSPVEENPFLWDDYEGDIPTAAEAGGIRGVFYFGQKWDDTTHVPALETI